MTRFKAHGLVLVLIAQTVTSFAFAKSTADQFGPVRQQQGGLCHISAVSSMFEAACFRKTGKRVKVSEAALYVQHLKSKWNDPSPFHKLNQNINGRSVTALSSNTQSIAPQIPGNFSGTDGGTSEETAEFLLKGKASVRDSDFPFDTTFTEKIQKIVAAVSPDEIKNHNLSLEQFAAKRITLAEAAQAQQTNREKTRAKAYDLLKAEFPLAADGALKADPDISACVNANFTLTQISEGHATREQVKAQLDKGLPVLCSVIMNYGSSVGPHVLILTDTRKTKKNGPEEFEIRDSNMTKPYWHQSFNGCNAAWILN